MVPYRRLDFCIPTRNMDKVETFTEFEILFSQSKNKKKKKKHSPTSNLAYFKVRVNEITCRFVNSAINFNEYF